MAKLLKFWLNARKCPHCANLHLFIAHDRNAEVRCFSLASSERLKSVQGLHCLPLSPWLLVPILLASAQFGTLSAVREPHGRYSRHPII